MRTRPRNTRREKRHPSSSRLRPRRGEFADHLAVSGGEATAGRFQDNLQNFPPRRFTITLGIAGSFRAPVDHYWAPSGRRDHGLFDLAVGGPRARQVAAGAAAPRRYPWSRTTRSRYRSARCPALDPGVEIRGARRSCIRGLSKPTARPRHLAKGWPTAGLRTLLTRAAWITGKTATGEDKLPSRPSSASFEMVTKAAPPATTFAFEWPCRPPRIGTWRARLGRCVGMRAVPRVDGRRPHLFT